MPVRWRLTLWFSLILFLILVVSGVVVHDLLNSRLSDEVDKRLHAHSAEILGTFTADQDSHPTDHDAIQTSLPPIDEFVSPGIYIQIIDPTGTVVIKSDNLGDQQLPLDPSLVQHGFDGNQAFGTVPATGGANLRIMVSPLTLGEETLLLEVAESLEPVDEVLSQMRWYLSAVAIGALAVSVAAGVVLARRALSPVERITRTARSIAESSDLARRVEYTGPSDELGKLAATFDDMIAHLERVFESQKNFVADASHELRNPLTVIRGNLDLLKRNLSEEDRSESVRAIGAEVERMARITDDLLLLAEIDSGQFERRETVSLRAILLEQYENARRLTESHMIELGEHKDLRVSADSHAIRRMMANLVENAVKYTPAGGTISLSLTRDGDSAQIRVADTGPGIPQEHLPHLFDRFYRVDKARSRLSRSTGLGLAIVKGIAEQHGGSVSVTSEEGKGTTFTVRLRL